MVKCNANLLFIFSMLASLTGEANLQAQQQPVFKVLYSAGDTGPVGLPADLFEVTPGLFYGLGSFDNGTYGGTVFSISSAGTLKLVYGLPEGSAVHNLVQAPDGLLWGDYETLIENQADYYSVHVNGQGLTTYSTGKFGDVGYGLQPAPLNTLFNIQEPVTLQTYVFSKIDSDGTILGLHEFSASDGVPYVNGPVIRDVNGNFYGIAIQSQGASAGWIFQLTPQGQYSKFAQFSEFPIGHYSGLPLTEAFDGSLYGAFATGGTNNTGEIYRVSPTGVLSIAASFPVTGMYAPQSLMEASDGNLYGTTASVPSYVFRLVRSTNTLEQIYALNGSQGQCICMMVEGMDGKLYGVAGRGGAVGIGTVFSLDIGMTPPLPAVTQVIPPAPQPGQQVLLWGNWLLGVTGVSFNGIPATQFKSTTVQTITATMPAGAAARPITVTTINGSFTVQ